MQGKNNIYIAIVIIIVSFVWIGYAYTMGIKASQMLLHPIVPILLIALLARFRGDESTKYVVNIIFVFIGIWLFDRLQGV
ncbi:MAG: hypothetical protein ACPL7B_17975, partial [Candidatus Poribacteria bacterium]